MSGKSEKATGIFSTKIIKVPESSGSEDPQQKNCQMRRRSGEGGARLQSGH